MLSRGYILVVDDEVNLCRILDAKLTKSGYEVITVHDGLQAVEKVREKQFDLVLLDLILPKLDGLEALEKIRTINSNIPVIIMTACENTEAVTRALSKGASAFVSKPFDLDRLVTLVQNTSHEGRAIATDSTVIGSSGLFRKDQIITLDKNESPVQTKLTDRKENTIILAPVMPKSTSSFSQNDQVEGHIVGTDALYRFTGLVKEVEAGSGNITLDLPQVMHRIQRRKSPRLEIKTPVDYREKDSDSRNTGYTENIGIGGATIVTPAPIDTGKTVELEVKAILHIEKVKCTGQVLRCTPSNDPIREQYKVALKFDDADPELRRALLQHLATSE